MAEKTVYIVRWFRDGETVETNRDEVLAKYLPDPTHTTDIMADAVRYTANLPVGPGHYVYVDVVEYRQDWSTFNVPVLRIRHWRGKRPSPDGGIAYVTATADRGTGGNPGPPQIEGGGDQGDRGG